MKQFTECSLNAFISFGFDSVSTTHILNEKISEIARCVMCDTAARGGVEAVMKDSFFNGVDWKVLSRDKTFCVLPLDKAFRKSQPTVYADGARKEGGVTSLDRASVARE